MIFIEDAGADLGVIGNDEPVCEVPMLSSLFKVGWSLRIVKVVVSGIGRCNGLHEGIIKIDSDS
jgi:hypothetical protein